MPESFQNATLIVPEYNEAEGVRSKLSREGNSVTVDVSETPIFIKLSMDNKNQEAAVQKLILPSAIQLSGACEDKFDSSEIYDFKEDAKDPLLREFSHLFDEKETMPATPFSSLKELAKPTTTMASVTWKYPMDCILYFDADYTFTFAGYYDSYGSGKFEIYDDVTNELIFTTQLSDYQRTMITELPEKVTTNRLRIVRYNDSKINSLMFFGYEEKAEPAQEEKSPILPDAISLGNLCEPKFSKTEICDFKTPVADKLLREFANLFDERDTMPSTPSSTFSELAKPVTTIGSVSWKYPMDCILYFNESKTIKYVGYYDSFGVGKFEIYNDVTNELMFTTNLGTYQRTIMTELPETVTTDRLRIVRYNDAKINSLMFYGN